MGARRPHCGWVRLMLDRRYLHGCLVEVPNAPCHCAECAHAEADFDEETTLDNYFSPEAGHRAGPGGAKSKSSQGLLFSEARKPYAEAVGHGRRGRCARVWSPPPPGREMKTH